MTTTADRVRELIQTSGLSQHAFAAEVGLDDSKLSKSLSGARRFSSLDLARVAERCDVTVDWLITGAEPELVLAARTAGGSAAAAIREAERLSSLRSDMTFLGFSQPWRPTHSVMSMSSGSGKSHAVALAAAALSRVHDEGSSETEADLAAIIERVFGVDVAVADLGPDFDGLAVASAETKLILLATSRVPARQRFTLAHELGHLLAGDDQELHVDKDIYAASNRRKPTERRANAFAAAFLLPETVLRSAVGQRGITEESFARLAWARGVSPAALSYRLLDLRLIDAGTCDRFRTLSGAKVARMAGKDDDFARSVATAGTVRAPGLLVRDTYAAYDSGLATLRPYANLIGTDVDALREALEAAPDHVAAS
jgi:Zn-dependent peptidase ImmA (M78 family)/transcriptional regulator with XRE-family HTH domain